MSEEQAGIILSQYADYLELKRHTLNFSNAELIEALKLLSYGINDKDDHK